MSVPGQRADQRTIRGVPQLDRRVHTARSQQLTVGRKRRGKHATGVPGQRADQRSPTVRPNQAMWETSNDLLR